MAKRVRWYVETAEYEMLNLEECGLICLDNEYIACANARGRYNLLAALLGEDGDATVSIYHGNKWHTVCDVYKRCDG